MSTFGALLMGGDQLIFDATDFVSVKLANAKKGSPKPQVKRVILTIHRSVSRHDGRTHLVSGDGQMGTESRVIFRKYETTLYDSTPITWLRAGRIMLDFYMRGPMKRAVCVLTKDANAQLQVWLDSLEENGKIKS